MKSDIVRSAERAIESRVFPGCVIGLLDGDTRDVFCFGRYTYDASSAPVTPTSLYDCASLTKSVVTASLALRLLDEGKLRLEDKLITFVPEYLTLHREAVTIRHLLTYTLGNSLPLSQAGTTVEDIMYAVCHETTQVPGTFFNYSNTPALLLGLAIERVLGQPLGQAARTVVFEPLAMHTATFSPQGAVPTEDSLHDRVHDESARVFAREGKMVGHAGLFATSTDILQFMKTVLREKDQRICTNQIEHLGASAGMGWELDQEWMGAKRSKNTFGKTGFTGCSITANFDAQKAVVILSNRTYPKRPDGRGSIDEFRRAVCDIVFI